MGVRWCVLFQHEFDREFESLDTAVQADERRRQWLAEEV